MARGNTPPKPPPKCKDRGELFGMTGPIAGAVHCMHEFDHGLTERK